MSSITLYIGFRCPMTSVGRPDRDRGERVEDQMSQASRYSTRAAVAIKLITDAGNSHFHPNCINWS